MIVLDFYLERTSNFSRGSGGLARFMVPAGARKQRKDKGIKRGGTGRKRPPMSSGRQAAIGRSAVKGAKIGAGIGAVRGAIGNAALAKALGTSNAEAAAAGLGGAIGGAAKGGVVGAGIGAGVGAYKTRKRKNPLRK